MADRASLEFLGLILAGVTAAVVVTAAIVVGNNLDTKGARDKPPVAPAALTPKR